MDLFYRKVFMAHPIINTYMFNDSKFADCQLDAFSRSNTLSVTLHQTFSLG